MIAPASSLRVVPLGGLGEVGMNCLALVHDRTALLVDCGVSFGSRELGVDVVHPAFDYLADVDVAAVFLTHGHEDHIGAVPYLLRTHGVPVYGPRFALGLLRTRAREHEVLAHADLREVIPGERVRIGPFEVEPVRVTHSIADATALAVRTPSGLVVHTGDFKFDEDPPDGEVFDEARFAELSTEGIRLLLSDSTNVDARGPTGGERGVGDALEGVVAGAEQAVVVGLFASNVHRLRMIGEIAVRHGRKIVLLGRSMRTHSEVARATLRAGGAEAGSPYLGWPSDLVWPDERARELPRRRILALATGTQGEEAAALARLARGEHPALDLGPGDVVALSSRVIPGNEAPVMQVLGGLLRRGASIRSWWSDRGIHVSGHAHADEQRRMIRLCRPRAFVPVHGTAHHLHRHAELARSEGVEHVTVLENGDVGELAAGGDVRKVARAPVGRVHVYAGKVIPAAALRERQALAVHGATQVVVPVDAMGRLAGRIQVIARGVTDAADACLLDDARREAEVAVEALARGVLGPVERPAIEDAASRAVRRIVARAVGSKPVTTVAVVRVA